MLKSFFGILLRTTIFVVNKPICSNYVIAQPISTVKMSREVKDSFGPCGIFCEKCFAYSEGVIRQSSKTLAEALGNFDVYAERFSVLLDEPSFREYPGFRKLLEYFSTVDCKGCRKEHCRLFKSCMVRDCVNLRGRDFCYECPEFPCDHTGFDEHLHKRSVAINLRIREVGMENYYREIRDKPRYS